MRPRGGFSLVEVLVALVILSVASLGSAATIGFAARTQARAAALRTATAAISAHAARLLAGPCHSIGNDSVSAAGLTVSWTVTSALSLAHVRLAARVRDVSAERTIDVACP